MVRSRPVRKDTVYEQFKKIPGVCMYCGRPVVAHWNPCWIPVSAQTTATTTSEDTWNRTQEARERSRRVLEEIEHDQTPDEHQLDSEEN